jgi:hypothetical protein
MRWISLCLAVGVAACSNADGTRGQCAEGGELSACPEAERTAEGACWRLVDCGAIPLKKDTNPDGTDNTGIFDWNNCVATLQRSRDDQQRVVIDCIAVSTCDSLKPADIDYPDTAQIGCLVAGGID